MHNMQFEGTDYKPASPTGVHDCTFVLHVVCLLSIVQHQLVGHVQS